MNNEEKILSLLAKQGAMLETVMTEQKTTNERIGAIESKMGTMASDVSTLKSDVSTLKSDVDEIKGRIAIIENEHGTKINAGLDGHSLLMDISCQIREDISLIKYKLDRQDNRILRLELKHSLT